MIIDNSLLFTGTSNGSSGGVTASANTDAPTTGTQTATNIVDVGVNSGIPSSANGGGARDMGIGYDLKLFVQVTTAFTGGTSLQLVLSGAPDNGSGAPGSYTTMWTSAAIAEASLVQGAQLSNIDIPRPVPGQPVPRFYRLQYVSVGTHTAGAVEAAVVLDRIDSVLGSSGNMSGYPAGITVSN